ncbi:EthD family reductase [Sulfitobacter sp. JBTF-M27]|uniref:EthD family reductase n=1 Tax=Sulfitobacter sediminilitoris TaxID=2698830 RepID=A0A6P0CE89_9RHOB|nr:EthD family reductase [Sulfitobacter sediminilitoris]NEK24501.1 EthD family reductase [Sulfitobacter sediminilitoris]
MSATLQVIYPNADGTNFDYDYYMSTHMGIVGDCIGEHIQSTLVTKGVAGGPDTPPGYHAIASIVFADGAALDAAMGRLGPALEDIPNFTNAAPQVLIGNRLDG